MSEAEQLLSAFSTFSHRPPLIQHMHKHRVGLRGNVLASRHRADFSLRWRGLRGIKLSPLFWLLSNWARTASGVSLCQHDRHSQTVMITAPQTSIFVFYSELRLQSGCPLLPPAFIIASFFTPRGFSSWWGYRALQEDRRWYKNSL